MTRTRQILALTLLALTAAPAAWAARRDTRETSIARPWRHGSFLVLSTGTSGGECAVHGERLACFDGLSVAVADLENGCGRVAGGGRCTILEAGGAGMGDDPPSTVGAQESSIDVECETGSKKGTVYTIADGDGHGACGPNRDVDGKVNGGTCTKGGSECGSVDCDHGCGTASANCECHVRTRARSVQTSD